MALTITPTTQGTLTLTQATVGTKILVVIMQGSLTIVPR